MQVFGADNVYFEVQKQRPGAAGQGQRGHRRRIAREVGRPLVGTADVHYLGREDYHNHSALLCVQTKSTLAEPKLTFDTNEFYLKDTERDDGRLRALARGGAHLAGDRRALRRGHRAGQACSSPATRRPTAGPRARYLRAPGRGGAARALRRPAPGRGGRAPGHGARGDRPDGLRRLLPDRLGLRQVRQGQRHRGRPRARLGGGLDRLLRPRHHRGRPAGLRPAVRALPQPRAGVHAGHRHRLLGEGPRRASCATWRTSTAASRSPRS